MLHAPSTPRGAAAAAAVLLMLAACAPAASAVASPPACVPGTGAMTNHLTLSASGAPLRLGAAPLTLGPCRLSAAAVRSVLAASAPDAAMLVAEGVRAPRGATVRVFVDRPRADASTPTGDPAFAGSFTLLGDGQGGGVGLRVALGPQLAAAVRGDGAFTLTLVAVDAQGRAEDPGLTIDRLRVELR